MMSDLVRFIVSSLVEKQGGVNVEYKTDGPRPGILVTVDERDMGKVIGRGGCTIRALRSVVAFLQLPENPVDIVIVE